MALSAVPETCRRGCRSFMADSVRSLSRPAFGRQCRYDAQGTKGKKEASHASVPQFFGAARPLTKIRCSDTNAAMTARLPTRAVHTKGTDVTLRGTKLSSRCVSTTQ